MPTSRAAKTRRGTRDRAGRLLGRSAWLSLQSPTDPRNLQTCFLPALEAGTPDPGMGRAGPPEASLLGVQTAATSQGHALVCVCVLTFSSLEKPRPVELPTLVTSLEWIPSVKNPVSKLSLSPRSWRSGLQHGNLVGDTGQPMTVPTTRPVAREDGEATPGAQEGERVPCLRSLGRRGAWKLGGEEGWGSGSWAWEGAPSPGNQARARCVATGRRGEPAEPQGPGS